MALQCNGATCVIAVGGTTTTVEHASIKECDNYYSMLSCRDPDHEKADYTLCNQALDSAKCVDTSKGKALDLPGDCSGLAL